VSRGTILALAGLAVVAIGAGYLLLRPAQEAPITGMVRATEIRLAPEVGGQLASIKVRRGDAVHAGQVVAELSAVELNAAVAQARAEMKAATASRDNVYAGVRAEQVAELAAEIGKAKSRSTYVDQQLDRAAQLVHTNTASRQVLDQAISDAAAASADVAEAEANHDAAAAGPTKQERAIADAQVRSAAAELAVLQRRLEKTVLRSPVDGVASVIVAEVGENVRAGQPVLAIEEAGKQFLSFNVREDMLRGASVGTAVEVRRPGSGETARAVVSEVSPLGTYATWQAERAVGGHDLNTLRLRLDLQGDASALEPGMTVWMPR
jgi:HlyD family secretion protein